jgi:hypothetical protein
MRIQVVEEFGCLILGLEQPGENARGLTQEWPANIEYLRRNERQWATDIKEPSRETLQVTTAKGVAPGAPTVIVRDAPDGFGMCEVFGVGTGLRIHVLCGLTRDQDATPMLRR